MNWHTIKAVYLSVYWERRNLGSLWVTWMLLALGLGLSTIPILILEFSSFSPTAKASAAVPAWNVSLLIFTGTLFAITFLWLSQLVMNGVRQCSPTNAHLTPGQRKSNVIAFGLAWLTSTLSLAMLGGIVTGHFILCWLGIGISVLLLIRSFTLGGWFYGIPFYFLGVVQPRLNKFVHEFGLWEGEPLPSVIAIGLMFVLFFIFMRHIFGIHGERAYAAQTKMRKNEARFKLGGLNRSPIGLEKLFSSQWLYDIALARSLAKKNLSANNKARELLRFGFGYDMHWSFCVASGIVFIAFLLVFVLIGDLYFGWNTATYAMGGGFVALPITMFPLVVIQRALTTLRVTANDQGLLKLLPSVEQDKSLNKLVAKMILRQFVTGLGIGILITCIALGLFWYRGLDVRVEYLDILLCGFISILPISVFALGDYSSMKRPYGNGVIAFIIAYGLFAVLAAFRHTYTSPQIFWSVSTAIVCGTAIMFISRWKTTINAPVALPVGRLAT